MKKAVSILLILNLILVFFISSPTLAQQLPIKETATTIVGEGSSITGSELPPKPPLSKFMGWFNVYQCQGLANNSSPNNCKIQNKDSKLVQIAYRRFSDPLRSTGYVDALKVKSRKINLQFGSVDLLDCKISGGGHWGRGSTNDDIRLDGYATPGCEEENRKWSMIHESGHIIQERSPAVYDSFKVNDLADKDGNTADAKDCYDPGSDGPYLQTYAYRSSAVGGGSKAESFGEAIGANVVCGPEKSCQKSEAAPAQPIQDYPNKCKATYRWVRDNVFGGVDFNGLGTGGSADGSGFVFYCQGDPDWNSSGAICGADGLTQRGCLPTSIAMIFSSLGKTRTPPDIIRSLKNFGIPKNRIGCTTPGYITDFVEARWFQDEGFKTSDNLVDYPNGGNIGELNLVRARDFLNGGGKRYIIAGAADFPCTFQGISGRCRNPNSKIGHAFVITDVNPQTNTVTIRDPIGCTAGGKEINYVRERPVGFVSDWNASYGIVKL